MIHYHGTPCGGVRFDLPSFYTKRHALVSYAHPEDIGVIAECCQSFCLDNGAFSFWKSGTAVDWDGYMGWVKLWSKHPSFDFYLIPDTIDGTVDDNKHLMFHYGRERYAVPVYHFHEPLDHLENLVRNYHRIALGSSGEWPNPGTDSWWSRMAEIMAVCCDEDGRPKCKLHGLRMLDPEIFAKSRKRGGLPLSSADSCNAVLNAKDIKRFGMYPPPTAAQRSAVIADRVEWHNGSHVWTPSPQSEFELIAL